MSGSKDVTTLLAEVRHGKKEAMDELMAVVYPELRDVAGHYLRSERPDHTLQTTALVHEAYVRIFGAVRTDWKNRADFFAAVAKEMRRILVDYARSRNAQKRPGRRVLISLADIKDLGSRPDRDLVALDEALTRLEQMAPRAASDLARRCRARHKGHKGHKDLYKKPLCPSCPLCWARAAHPTVYNRSSLTCASRT